MLKDHPGLIRAKIFQQTSFQLLHLIQCIKGSYVCHYICYFKVRMDVMVVTKVTKICISGKNTIPENIY